MGIMFDARKAMELQNLHSVETFRKLTIPQMHAREKLIELLESAESAVYWNSMDKGFIVKIADHLIANDVVPVVRCKDCKQWCRNSGITESPNGHCFYHDIETNGHDFCSYGERKDDDCK